MLSLFFVIITQSKCETRVFMVKEKGNRAKAVLRVHSRCRRGSRLTRSRLSERRPIKVCRRKSAGLGQIHKPLLKICRKLCFPGRFKETIWLNDGQGQLYNKPDFNVHILLLHMQDSIYPLLLLVHNVDKETVKCVSSHLLQFENCV